ncbi:MAG: penicillin-binding transpeptidase domain-containing protein [Clostridiaceae bacterium]|nr:penicillin-binding transpeptidase domain-containing protein [Clostridiaceae bacterium]
MQRKADSIMRKRLMFVAVVFGVLCFIALAGKIFYLQVFKHEEYQQKAISQQTRDKTVPAARGTIYDRNMKPLAISAGTEMVTLEAVKIDDEAQGELIAKNLSEILGLDYEAVLQKVQAKGTYAVIKKNVEKEVADKVRTFVSENAIDSVYMVNDTTRYYPYGNFLSHTIGFVGTDNQGLYGLESYYDSVLKGINGRVIKAANAKGAEMPFDYEMYYAAQDGNSLVLTIDEVIQHYLEKNLETAYADNKVADHVTGIVMDVNTGAVLALANKPDFDLNNAFTISNADVAKQISEMPDGEEKSKARSNALSNQWLNLAITYTYYPGSTFKIITASSALEEKVISTASTFYCPGYRQVRDRKISCWKTAGHGSETFVDAIKNSCNPAFMEIGSRLGVANFYKYYKAFGLSEKTGVDLPGESVGFFWDIDKMSEVDLAVASFGQNFTITPLQLITAVSSVANGGELVTPHVVGKIIDSDGNTVSATETNVVRQVISKETSDIMCDVLEQVVASGTGKNAYVAGYRVAGKTGTTEKIAKQNQTGQTNLRISSFMAFAPADDPKIAVLVLLDEPTVQPVTGGITVAPVVKRIMEDVLPYLEVDPMYTEGELQKRDTTVPNMIGLNLAQAKSAAGNAGVSVRAVGNGDTVTAQVPSYSSTVSRSSTVVLYMGSDVPQATVIVPDLTGLGVSAVKQRLAALGLYYKSAGTEYGTGNLAVTKQDTLAGSEVAAGTVISVEFTDLNQLSQ